MNTKHASYRQFTAVNQVADLPVNGTSSVPTVLRIAVYGSFAGALEILTKRPDQHDNAFRRQALFTGPTVPDATLIVTGPLVVRRRCLALSSGSIDTELGG